MSFFINKYVFWLQISVNNIILMQIFYCYYELTNVEPGHIFCEFSLFIELCQKIYSWTVLHNKINVKRSLKGIENIYYKAIL